MDYVLIAFRLVLAFIMVLVFFQFSGAKRQFTQMTSFDLISNFILSAILGGFLFNPQTTWYGFIAILGVYFFLNWLINYLARSTTWGRGLILGTPIVIISDGAINEKNLRKANLNLIDFMSLLRAQKVRSLNDVQMAQIEVSGDVSIVRKGEQNFAVMLIENGKIQDENLRQIKKTRQWLEQQLKKQRITDIKNVFYAQWLKDELYVLTYK